MAKAHPRQQALALKIILREPTLADLRAAYEQCVQDQQRMPFELALQNRPIFLALKNQARSTIFKRGGM